MRRIRFSLRSLILLMTTVAIALGALVWYYSRESQIQKQVNEATPYLGKAFEEWLPELERNGVVGMEGTGKDFESLFEYWAIEVRSQPHMAGLQESQAGYYRTRLADRNKATSEIVRLVVEHFSNVFRPLGFTTIEAPRTKLSHGDQTTTILVDRTGWVELDVRVFDGPDGFYFIEGELGRR